MTLQYSAPLRSAVLPCRLVSFLHCVRPSVPGMPVAAVSTSTGSQVKALTLTAPLRHGERRVRQVTQRVGRARLDSNAQVQAWSIVGSERQHNLVDSLANYWIIAVLFSADKQSCPSTTSQASCP